VLRQQTHWDGVAAARLEQTGDGGFRLLGLPAADAASGEIRGFDLGAGSDLGVLPGFRGSATALALDGTGGLRVKTDLGLTQVQLAAGTGCVRSGRLEAGPLDAGVDQVWERLTVAAEAPAGTALRLEVHLASAASAAPAQADWIEARSLDTLLPPPGQPGAKGVPAGRFLWLRITLFSSDGRTTPTLSQVHAVTKAPSYLDHLPAVYAREDQAIGFLRRWLALFRSELGDLETLLDDMPRRFDPLTAPADHLAWLAAWVAFELPGKEAPDGSLAWLRGLIRDAHAIHAWRGTKTGLSAAIERETGLRPQILEACRERRIWQLDTHCRLGFDTGLAPAQPDGAVVPDPLEAPVLGELVVGEGRPQEAGDLAEPLFDDEAHLFSVVLPVGRCIGESERERLRAIIDAEKPAHTDYRLCLVEVRMRVGFQARIGVDTLIAGPLATLALDASRLDLDAVLGADGGGAGMRVGRRSNIGQNARLG
jgi:phage tail-like protein